MGPARQTELSHWVYQRCRDEPEHRRCAQSSHAKILQKDNRRAAPVVTWHRVARPGSSAHD